MSVIYKSYQHQSANFDPARMDEYSLAVFVKEGLLICSILSGEEKILSVTEYRTQQPIGIQDLFESVLLEEKLGKENFRKVKVICGVDDFSLLPSKLFDRKHSAEFAKILISDEENADHIDIHELNHGNAVAIYSIPHSLKKKLELHFKDASCEPFCRSAIDMGFELADQEANLILVNMFENQFIITGIRDRKLHICNSYDFKEVADIVYFVQLVAEIMSLGKDDFQVYFAGEFETDSTLIRQLRKYIPGLQVPQNRLIKTFDTQNEKLPSWKYAFMSF